MELLPIAIAIALFAVVLWFKGITIHIVHKESTVQHPEKHLVTVLDDQGKPSQIPLEEAQVKIDEEYAKDAIDLFTAAMDYLNGSPQTNQPGGKDNG